MERLQNAGASLVTQSDPSRPSTSSSFQHWDETSQTAVSLKKLLGINLTMPTLLHTFFKIFFREICIKHQDEMFFKAIIADCGELDDFAEFMKVCINFTKKG